MGIVRLGGLAGCVFRIRLAPCSLVASFDRSSGGDVTDDRSSTPQPGDQTTIINPSLQQPATFGDYQLLQRIGEGGMGEVWLAQQTQPIRRRVALKIIKAGMDTARVVARFEAERQALALMSHPSIAHIFDAGSTPEGRPYFV